MSYATATDVQERMTRTMGEDEIAVCVTLLEDAAVFIDACNADATADVKKLVSCRMVIRAMEDTGSAADIPIGATQGSMSALGYYQSWTLGSGSTGEIYLSKAEKKLLGAGNRIGSYSPVQECVPEVES